MKRDKAEGFTFDAARRDRNRRHRIQEQREREQKAQAVASPQVDKVDNGSSHLVVEDPPVVQASGYSARMRPIEVMDLPEFKAICAKLGKPADYQNAQDFLRGGGFFRQIRFHKAS